ncbi:MAG: hypothetical protein NT080_14570 [Spirochaetes bacterium]|nr:hypothetical protein [Spirochaetota bacterium]
MDILRGARLFAPEDGSIPSGVAESPLLASYLKWELSLRNELAKIRAHQLGKSPERYVKPGEPEWEAARVAQSAAACDNPLEAELLIERERWALIERLETGHFFDLESLLAYGLKLQALERRAKFETERGERAYSSAYESILSGVAAVDGGRIDGSAATDMPAPNSDKRPDRRDQ